MARQMFVGSKKVATGLVYLQEFFKDKRVLIFGYGREGKSTETFLKNYCSVASIDIFEGKLTEINEDAFDVIMKSPGIVMLERREKYTSQTELFLNAFGHQTIGITGTKGKSTTSAMLAKVLAESHPGGSVLLGNIGLPCFDYAAEIKEGQNIVFELSCHQLLHITKAPHISVFLNLYEEHLDYYGDMAHYFAAKSHIATNQEEGDYFLRGENVPEIQTKATTFTVSKPSREFHLSVHGEHNKRNAEFVLRAAALLPETNLTLARESIESFQGLPHRLQYVTTVDGVSYYDDSISTIPEAALQAAESIPDSKTLLIGGMDRGIDYSLLVSFIRERKDLLFILMYETGKRIHQDVKKEENVVLVEDLKEAVSVAREKTKEGAVILSPAAASYGYFKNFEERGDVFQALVKERQ